MHYYEVAPTKIIRAGNDVFTYAFNESLQVGQLVEIPLGKNSATGLVIRSVGKPSFETRPITRVVEQQALPLPLVKVSRWISDYYATPLATVLTSVLPRGLTKNRRENAKINQLKNVREHAPLSPTLEQQKVIDTILSTTSTTQILHGVTGSGKTLVYIECARTLFTKGKSSIILVPEIALTPQLVDEFTNVFNDQVLVVHSRQTEAERHRIWKQALNSQSPKIVIGPRSALFTPLRTLGLIIIDEFHEPTYKQEQSPRYSAIRVATMLAQFHNATTVLGSATPSISEYYLALHNGAPIHRLNRKAISGTKDPVINVIDMTKKINFNRHRFLSDQLLASIDVSLEQSKQTLIFHNRRGTTSITLCNSCGWTAVDPVNELPLTLHADKHQLISHVSDYAVPVPTNCPVCGDIEIIHKGIGTKLLETELQKLYPNKKIVRFDGDTSDADSIHNRYDDLYSGVIDIIIGTQVVAKGLDLPNLRTVGVIQADTGLSLPDFSSDERTFQLLAQVIGRVGRNQSATEAIIQTYRPSHVSISAGVKQDYETFYNYSIQDRQMHQFPPFVHLLKLTCIYKTEAATIKNTRKLLQELRALNAGLSFSGPAPAFYEKYNGQYRWQIIVKAKSRSHMKQLIEHVPKQHWQFELDPTNLL